jgi:hypothetical protein
MIIANNGQIGINTTTPTQQLEINSSTGNCLRLTYNDNNGSAVNYTDLSLNSSGALFLQSSNNNVIVGSGNDVAQTFNIGPMNTSATVGTLRLLNFGGANYIQSGINTTSGSSADFVISDYAQAIGASTRKIIFKAGGRTGFGTSTPARQLDVNATDGNCLRLTFNASAGSATTYCDYSLSSVGQMTFNAVGSAPSFNFTGGNISATIATAAQPNITSLGTLTSLDLTGAISGVTNLTMSGNLTGATSITATSLVGTLTTVAQPNITSVGILPNLLVGTNAKFGVASSSPQDIVHIEGSSNSFIGLQIENRNATASSSGTKISFAGFSSTNDNYEIARIAAITSTSGTPSSFQFGSLGFYTRGTDLSTNADERMRITNTGNVGIGLTSPSYPLDVNGATRSLELLAGTSTDTGPTRLISALDSGIGTDSRFITLGKANSTNNQFEIGYQHKIDGSATNVASFGFAGGANANRMFMLASGLFGFGTNNPAMEVEINNATGNCLRLTYNDSDGSAATYADVLMSSGGNLLLNPTGSFVTSNKRIQTTVNGLGFSHAVTNGAELASFVNSDSTYLGSLTAHPLYLMTGNVSKMIITNAGNVGIATTTPAYLLDVNGTAKASRLLLGTSTDTSRMISALDSSMTGGNARAITLGKENSTYNQGEITYVHVTDGSTSNYLALGLHSRANILVIIPSSGSSGSVGINKTNPVYSLDVNGTSAALQFYTTGTTATARYIGDWASSGEFGIGPDTTSTTDNTIRLGICTGSSGTWSGYANVKCANMTTTGTITSSGNITGGGNISCSGRISMSSGGLGFSHQGSGTAEIISYVDSGEARFGVYSNHPYRFLQNNQTRMTLGTNGYLGIGTITPGFPLDVDAFTSTSPGGGWQYGSGGSSSFSNTSVDVAAKFNRSVVISNGLLYVTSDKRLKQDLINLENDYCKRFIFETTPTQFKYKSDLNKVCNGYIAQEVFKAGFENLISIIPDDGLEEDIDADGFKSAENEKMILSYEGIIPILAKNIKNLYEENEVIKNENAELKNTINEILQRLSNLESQ